MGTKVISWKRPLLERELAYERLEWTLVSLRVFITEHHYFKLSKYIFRVHSKK